VKLTLYPADKGDCLLVTGADGRHLLVDGGMRESYRQYVAPALGRLKELDVVCVSHIDQDHISGVLQLLDDTVSWRVHDYQVQNGNPKHPAPASSRPPEIGEIWHNSFQEQIGKNTGPIENALVAAATILSGAETSRGEDLANAYGDLAASVSEAIQLSRRIGPGQLNIPLNPPAGGGLMFVGENPSEVSIGGMSILVIAPFEEDLRNLRTEWNDWLRKNRQALEDIRRKALQDEGQFSAKNEVERIIIPAVAQAEDLGRRTEVTVPNLASLMLLVEVNGTSLLLTGDGHAQELLRGLDQAGKLDEAGGIHVNALKVQHHGSEHNIDADFCRAVTADHYIFCANGAHENPDLAVLEVLIDSRLGTDSQRSPNAHANDRFTLWFNSHSSIAEGDRERAHMEEVEDLCRRRASPQMKVIFREQADSGLQVKL
jgi:beta-lactamase superfamily II metal-dependent hydrolase